MKVFLSGKMDKKHGAWRDALLGVRTEWVSQTRGYVEHPRWELRRIAEDGHSPRLAGVVEFPRQANNFVLGLHEYIGPYRLKATNLTDKGCCQGQFHGADGAGQHGWMDEEDRSMVATECMRAIRRADFVFAFINTPDCFGTLSEIGYAVASGVYVHVAVDRGAAWDGSDYWFVREWVDGFTPSGAAAFVEEDGGIERVFRDALVAWTARPQSPPRVTEIARSAGAPDGRLAALQSFQQIARWSADPRVRDEAERMVRRLSAG